MRPVNQYDLDGHYIRTYRSIEEAKNATGAVSIAHLLSGKTAYKSSGGYLWRADTGNHENIPPRGGMWRAVLQIDPKTNKVIEKYRSVTEAAKITGKSRASIIKSCKRVRNSAAGYIWRYADDSDSLVN